MQRYNLVTNCDEDQKREMLEDLPVSLTYEIAKPSAEDFAEVTGNQKPKMSLRFPEEAALKMTKTGN